MKDQLTLGEYIKRRRKELNLSLGDIANLAEVHYTYMSKIENNKKPLSVKTYARLADVLDIQWFELIKLGVELPNQIASFFQEMSMVIEELPTPDDLHIGLDGQPAKILLPPTRQLSTILVEYLEDDPSDINIKRMDHFLVAMAMLDSETRQSLMDLTMNFAKSQGGHPVFGILG